MQHSDYIDIVPIDGKIGNINYSFASCQFGDVIIASSNIGISYLHFIDDKDNALLALKKYFPNVNYQEKLDSIQQKTIRFLQHQSHNKLTLHIKGTDFQLKIWRALLNIPIGTLFNYSDIAQHINQSQASRAVGSAVGKNPIAYLIPCHRVIPKCVAPKIVGIGNYMWGSARKKAIIDWESKNQYTQ